MDRPIYEAEQPSGKIRHGWIRSADNRVWRCIEIPDSGALTKKLRTHRHTDAHSPTRRRVGQSLAHRLDRSRGNRASNDHRVGAGWRWPDSYEGRLQVVDRPEDVRQVRPALR